MTNVECKKCGKAFYAKPNWIKRGSGKYCSRPCAQIASRKGEFKKCAVCRKETYKPLRQIQQSKSGRHFCGKACRLFWLLNKQFGKDHANWRHGRSAYKGMLIRHKVKRACVFCGKTDKRILVAHHIDKDRQNNTIKNLCWLCLNCHYLVHNYPDTGQTLLKKLRR